jgi:hypothetical protein
MHLLRQSDIPAEHSILDAKLIQQGLEPLGITTFAMELTSSYGQLRWVST